MMIVPETMMNVPDLMAASTERLELIEKLLTIGNALSSVEDLGELLSIILSKSREITCSDAGSVFLIDRSTETPSLVFKIAQNDSLPDMRFEEFALPMTPHSLAGYVALTSSSLNISDAQSLSSDVPYKWHSNFDEDFQYRTCSVLVLPMQDNNGETIGVLQLINRKLNAHLKITPATAVEITQPYSEWEERIVRSLASQAAISIERNMLQESIENLFEGFVKAAVQVIESRDPTTSGHSERVADLTVRLAQEITTINMGPLQRLYFNPQQIQEIRYASLLHDFGKIGVSEAILNKRRKLYPSQLESIRQRIALAKRSLQLQCAEARFDYLINHPNHCNTKHNDIHCPHCHHLKNLEAELAQAIATLDQYQALVEEMNEPEAFVNKRFQELSEQAWHDLQALTSYHYTGIDGEMRPLLTPIEVEQLMLPMGNLTHSERLAIEAHVTHSYEFLKRIPWTKTLKDIPVIAYGHHEKLDGTGYPRGLQGDEIPIQTQMMSIADIYDALTAADRPYKRPLPLDVVCRILHEEAERGRINSDLLQVFLNREVYQVLSHPQAA